MALLRRHAQAGDLWTEAVLLGIEEQYHRHTGAARDNLLEVLYKLGELAPEDKAAERVVLWGGLIAKILGPAAISRDEGGRGEAKLEAFLKLLSGRLRGSLDVKERLRAGNLLAELGDPREEVMRPEATAFCHVPAGPFWMGEGTGTHGRHRCEALDYDYWMARFPVTVAQFRAFCEEMPFEPDLRETLKRPYNHPVLRLTRHEARAFSAWLTERQRAVAAERLHTAEQEVDRRLWEGLQDGRLAVALPSEAEWEKAARGTEGRTYPWGEAEPNPQLANCREAGIGGTSAVGCFPKGGTPEGILEMTGNVWEWTRSIWGEEFPYPYEVDEREEPAPGKEVARVLRGGSYEYSGIDLRVSHRMAYASRDNFHDCGFRVVVRPCA